MPTLEARAGDKGTAPTSTRDRARRSRTMGHHRNARRLAERSGNHNVFVSTRQEREHFGEGQNFWPLRPRGACESLRHLLILARNQPRVFANDDKIGIVRNILRRIRRSAREGFPSQHLRDRRIDRFVGTCHSDAAVAQQDRRCAHAHAGKADEVGFTKWKWGHRHCAWTLFYHAPGGARLRAPFMLATPASRNLRSAATRTQRPKAPPEIRKDGRVSSWVVFPIVWTGQFPKLEKLNFP